MADMVRRKIAALDAQIKTRREIVSELGQIQTTQRNLIKAAVATRAALKKKVTGTKRKATSSSSASKSRRTATKATAGGADSACLLCGGSGVVANPCHHRAMCFVCYGKKKKALAGTRRHVRCAKCDAAVMSIDC